MLTACVYKLNLKSGETNKCVFPSFFNLKFSFSVAEIEKQFKQERDKKRSCIVCFLTGKFQINETNH